MTEPHHPPNAAIYHRQRARLDAAAKIKGHTDAWSGVAGFLLAMTVIWWVTPAPVTFPILWAVAGAYGITVALRVFVIRRQLKRRLAEYPDDNL